MGTTTPQAKLDISGGSTDGIHITNTDQTPNSIVINNTTFGSTDSTGFNLWQDNSGIGFLTNNNKNAIRINSSGNVGIGANPVNHLSVRLFNVGDTGTVMDIGNAGGAYGLLKIQNTTGSPFQVFGASADDLALGANNNEYMRILGVANGNSPIGAVGIGTSTPLATLDVHAINGTLPVASISGKTSFASLVVDNSGVGNLLTASSSGLNRFVITQSGNVGYRDNVPK